MVNQFEGHSRLSRVTAEAIRPHLGARLPEEVRRGEAMAEAVATQPFFSPASHSTADFARIAEGIAQAFDLVP